MSRRDKPPPLPFETLTRVTRLGLLDGRTVMWLSAVFAIIAAMVHYITGAAAGCIAAGAGAMEIHGATLLQRGQTRGVEWLVRAQALLFLCILGYCTVRLISYPEKIILENLPADFSQVMSQAGLTNEQGRQLLRQTYMATYSIMIVVSAIYQGAMIRYYLRRRNAIDQALYDGSA